MDEPATLRRALGTVALTLYGVGVIVGAGIFVLIGEIAGVAGPASWMGFIGASLAALPTALSYAELSSRFPQSAGEAVFADRAFGRPGVSFLVGFLVVANGLMSTATVSHGFADYVRVAADQPSWSTPVLVVVFLGALSWLNDRGIEASTWINATFTTVSVVTLLTVAFAGASSWTLAGPEVLQASFEVPPGAVLGGVALAFYAFIGFEDICNVSEETRSPTRTVPRAILLSLTISVLVYVLVTITALSVLPVDELASAPAPLALLSERVLPGLSGRWIAVVAVLAVTNTALFNLIMTSRVFFGMAKNGWLPEVLGRVNERTKSPRAGVVLAFALATSFALTGVLGILAEATNVVILMAFAAVNVSLIVIRFKNVPADHEEKHFTVPRVVPFIGVACTLVLLTKLSSGAYARAGGLLAVGVLLHLVVRWRQGRSAKSAETEPVDPES